MKRRNSKKKSRGNSWGDYLKIKSVWHTIIRSNLKLGDKHILPTIGGRMEFTVIELTDKSALLDHNGRVRTRLIKTGKYVWKYNHVTWPTNLSACVIPIVYGKEVK